MTAIAPSSRELVRAVYAVRDSLDDASAELQAAGQHAATAGRLHVRSLSLTERIHGIATRAVFEGRSACDYLLALGDIARLAAEDLAVERDQAAEMIADRHRHRRVRAAHLAADAVVGGLARCARCGHPEGDCRCPKGDAA